MDTIAKMALTTDQMRKALAEYVCRQKGLDPSLLTRAGVGVGATILGNGDDMVTLVTIEQR
jgi:hypothetical protein